jgi:prolipoprotein diacylglyceryl transferase
VPVTATIPPPPFSGIELGPLDLRMYGILIAVGAFLALRMAARRYERFGGDAELAERVALWTLGAGLLGARIGYVIPRLDRFADDPVSVLYIWEGGLVFFGGLFAGALVGLLLMRREQGDVPAFADAVAPALPLAQAIGRWGNYFNQELYGRPTDLPWAVRIEGGDPRYPGVDTFHPTFLYESIGNLILVVVLLAVERTGRLRRGALMWVYAIGYGLLRASVESLRVDTDARYLGLSRNNWIAIGIVLAGIAGLLWWQKRGARLDAAGDDGPTEDAGDGPTALDSGTDTGEDDGTGEDGGTEADGGADGDHDRQPARGTAAEGQDGGSGGAEPAGEEASSSGDERRDEGAEDR